ncbi:MAG TPA: hypothetical protein VEJ18_20040 [Planctomycetota bacterium]|nr:hypothetical protein [Planctomycetota bacterium]
MRGHLRTLLAVGAMLALGSGAGAASAGDEPIFWYFDADAALRAAQRSGRPMVVLKVRADVGRDVKT